VAVQPDPYFALPSLYGAPAYSRPPRPPVEAPRPIDPDDLPISTQQTGEERRLAEALFASRSFVPAGVAGLETPGSGDPGYQAANGQPRTESLPFPRRIGLRVLADRIRPRG
jgi:hypothetical protein